MDNTYITTQLPTFVDELAFVDEDIAAMFRGGSVQWTHGTPTNMQLIKELRLLRGAIESMGSDIALLSDLASKEQVQRVVRPRATARGYAAIGLDHPKCPANVGGVMRAAGCYGASMIAMAGHRFGKAPTDVQKQWRRTPVICTDDLRLVIPYDCVPVAVELIPGAISLTDYQHPERAFYVFGPEDGTLGERITSWCRDVVYVPMDAGCMNLAATVNVVLYDRMAKARLHLRRPNGLLKGARDEA